MKTMNATIGGMLGYVMAALLISVSYADNPTENWHRFRGPDGNGVAADAKPPLKWSGTSDNLSWKFDVPGQGSSSPIVWGDKVFVTSAVDTGKAADGSAIPANPGAGQSRQGRQGRRRGRRRSVPKSVHEFWLHCVSLKDGKALWSKKLNEAVPHEAKHSTNTYASASAVTNGKHVYVSFGSFGIYCLDMNGNVVWERDLGDMRTRNSFGEGGSPALYENNLIVNWDHEGQSFLEVLDALTGQTRWKKNREEATGWATPRVVKFGDQVQVIINAATVRSYDLADGSEIWRCGGQTGNPIPTPMVMDDFVICMTGFRSSACYAIPLDSKGDVSRSERIRWNTRDMGPYVPTGVLYKGIVYGTKTSQPVLTAIDAKTGKTVIDSTRLDGIRTLYSSMVAANDHIYVTGRNGKTIVLKHGDEFEVVSTNDLGEPVDATPAIVGKKILIRGDQHLFCFED